MVASEEEKDEIVVENIAASRIETDGCNYNLCTLDSIETLGQIPVNTVVTKEQKNMLALEEVQQNEFEDGSQAIQDEEYLIGQPFTSITTNLFSYGGQNNPN